MSKNDFTPNSSTIAMFHHWIRERHRIYILKSSGCKPPWTEDPILKEYKFTNVFRQLDRGTKFLVDNVYTDVAFNIFMYRMINRVETFEETGFVSSRLLSWSDVKDALKRRFARGDKVFTSAHMTVGRAYEDKVDTTCQSLDGVLKDIRAGWSPWEHDTMEDCFHDVLSHGVYGIGKFIAYEIVCDFRWMIKDYDDCMTWSNIGPGARRGLMRLGLPVELQSLRLLLEAFPELSNTPHKPELREVEHSLCEFDKYERVRHGEGRPKERYDYSQWISR